MRIYRWLLISLLAVPPLVTVGCSSTDEDEASAGEKLAIGSPAPAFDLIGSDGSTYRLEDYSGRQAVVIAWFPKAFTGG